MQKIVVSFPKGNYKNDNAVENVVRYILRLGNRNLAGGYGVLVNDLQSIIEQFYQVKQVYGKMDGKQIIHIVFSVEKTLYLKPEQVKDLGYMLAEYFGNERQVVFAVHDDTDQLHIHMGVNTIAYTNGAYQGFFEIEDLKRYAEVCIDQVIDRVWFGKN